MDQEEILGQSRLTSPIPTLSKTTRRGRPPKKDLPKISLRLTERDYAVFQFLLDQKFASLEVLYLMFFDQRESVKDPLPAQFAVARQRLGILKRAGLIHTQRVYSEAKSLYLLSQTGHKALQAKYTQLVYAPPMREVDFRNYDHDMRVSLVRVALSRSGKALKWYSERRVRMQGFQVEGVSAILPETIIPDGIFKSSKGERVAVEVEATIRKKSRFRFKVQEYEALIGQPNPLIHRVLFVACSDAVGKDLAEVIEKRSGFVLETYSHFVNGLFPNPAQTLDQGEENDGE